MIFPFTFMLKELPISITKRISNISSGEEIIDKATPIYQTALTSTSYNVILIYTKIPNKGIEEKKKQKNLMAQSALFQQRESKCC